MLIQGAPGIDFRLGLIELQFYTFNKNEEWPLLIIPDVVGRTVEVTRGIIKIQYEKEKPKVEIEISSDEESKQIKGKTTQGIFLQKLPDNFRPIYENYFDRWQKEDKILISWGTVGFSLRVNNNSILKTIFDAYPEQMIALIRFKDVENLNIPKEIYEKYLEEVKKSPRAESLLNQNKKYINNNEMTPEDLQIILQASTNLAINFAS